MNEIMCVDNHMVVELYYADGSVAERYLGPSLEQIKHVHEHGQCDMYCPICYEQAMRLLDEMPV